MKKLYGVIKFLFDEIISFLALIILFVPFIVIGVIIKCSSKGPVFFKQNRVGKNKKIFKMHKFRTMRQDTPHNVPTHMLKNPDAYITKIGKFLRKTSLDELPQIIDIFRGKMSIIGPRPALYNQDDLIALRDKYNANSVRPGLTGWAQINGRDSISIEEKAKLDGYYVANYGLKMDLRCFFKSVSSVIGEEGVVEGGTGTLEQQAESAVTNNVEEDK